MKLDEAAGVRPAEIEQVLRNGFGASVEDAVRVRPDVPLEEVAVQDSVDLAVFTPDERGGSRPRADRAAELDRRGQPRHVEQLEWFRAVESRARHLRGP